MMRLIWSGSVKIIERIMNPEPVFVGLYLENGMGTSHSLGRGCVSPYNPPGGDGVFSPLPHLPFSRKEKEQK